MKRILTSLHDTNTVGLDHDKNLLVRKGLIIGSETGGSVHGQAAIGSPAHCGFFEDFDRGFQSTVTWLATEGTDSATSDANVTGIAGGALRLTTGDAGTGLAADTEQVTTRTKVYKAANGDLTYEIRVKLSAITTCWAFFGLTDTVAASLEAPIESAASADTLSSTATDAVGWMFDTRMSTDNWWMVGVANNVDATAQNSGYAPVADTYEVLRITLNTDGDALFYRNGVKVGTVMADAVTPSVMLAPIMAVSKTSVAASMTCDIDYLHVSMKRA